METDKILVIGQWDESHYRGEATKPVWPRWTELRGMSPLMGQCLIFLAFLFFFTQNYKMYSVKQSVHTFQLIFFYTLIKSHAAFAS